MKLQIQFKQFGRSNKYIDETSPWNLAKEMNENQEKLKSSIYHLIANLKQIAIMIRPFMESTSDNILRQIGIEKENINWDSLNDYEKIEGIKVIEKGEPIFMRLNQEEEVQYIKDLMKK